MVMQSCDRIRDHLLDFLEGDMPAQQSRAAEAHVARCPECARKVRELRGTLESLQSLPAPIVPETLLDEIRVVVRRRIAHESPPRLSFHRRVVAWLRGSPGLRPLPAVSVAAAVGLLLAISLVRAPRTPQPSPAPEIVAAGDAFPIAQNLDVLEQFELLQDLDLLEQFPMLRVPGNGRPLTMS